MLSDRSMDGKIKGKKLNLQEITIGFFYIDQFAFDFCNIIFLIP